MTPAPHSLSDAEFAFRRGSLLTVLGAVLVVSLVTLSVQAHWRFSVADQLLLTLLAAKNAALLAWLLRRPRAFRAVGLTELTIQACTAVPRVYSTLHSPPGYQGLGGYAVWMIFVYIVAFIVLPARQALLVSGAVFAGLLGVVTAYALDPATDPAMRVGLGNPLLQTMLMHATFIALLGWQQHLHGQFVRALLSARREATLAQLDDLTGLPNRRQLDRWLTGALEAREPLSVILLDLDHFKRVNDTFGHEVGDEVLRHVSGVLRGSVRGGERGGDRVGRWGGEEFLILVRGDQRAAQSITGRVRAQLADTRHPLVGAVTVSCGVAQALPGEAAHDLLRRADEALYAAKRAGRDTVEVAA
ncbi:sensor domain-containing diguanylate cyclase [Deinococcus xianganensis]|uniref:Diguanylate cyclase n=1 Tax=Deinococcus xianganensis TaxID=1507289 RepID=A0A6I4YGF7_9DEIO|nr:GGDEF domain-containing protein [Deinococcus xianganensis]MXV19091.1 diguanylate cyclase [Deinococcus xianganensis]